MRSLTSFQRQRHQLTIFIARLEDDVQRLQDTAKVLEGRIQSTQSALERAETSWRETAERMRVYQREHAGVPRSSLSNDVVFRALTSSLTTYRNSMRSLRDSLAEQKDLLDDVTTTQQQIITAKERERSTLASTITKSQQELQRLRSNKVTLLAELQKKQQSAQRVRSMISNLVARERQREEQRKRDQARTKSARPSRESAREPARTERTPSAPGFARRSLPWPTPSTTLLQGYGTYRNPKTGTTLENPGIDIRAAVGTRVSCISKGEVSSVTWLPGFGSLVIVDHQNGFRSVYANLATVSVRQGTAVQQGAVVGTSGENIDGALVHFELWYGRDRLNPATYLR